MTKKAWRTLTVLSILLGFALICTVGVLNNQKKYANMATVYVQDPTLPTSPLQGSGTKKDPYLITSVEELCLFRDHVNTGYDYAYAYVVQTTDLDLSEIENFEPIGLRDSGMYFKGYYDGSGHVIRNLTIHAPEEDVALFGHLAGTVMNLGIESSSITGYCVGSIASLAFTSDARIINCYSNATLTGYRAGGIADNFSSGLVANCVYTGVIHADLPGGILGYSGKATASFSPTYAATSPAFAGVLDEDCKNHSGTLFDSDRVCRILNRNLDDTAVNYLDGRELYRWQSTEGSIGFSDADVNLYPLQFAGIALLLLAVLLVINVLYITRAACICAPTKRERLKERWAYFVSAVSDKEYRFHYIFIAMLQFCWTMVLAGVLAGNTNLLFAFTFNNGQDLFMDFFNPLATADKGYYWLSHLYEADTYPPLANAFFWLFSLFIPKYNGGGSGSLRTSFAGMIYFLFAFTCIYALYVMCRKKYNGKHFGAFFGFGLALCAPVIFNVERGNILLLALVFTGVFLFGYNSENRTVRECALICLALAAGIKIYPAVFGLLLVREKRYKEAFRCAVYGVVIFFAPFLLYGGVYGVAGWIRNLTAFVGGNTAATRDHLINYANLISNLTQLLFRNAEIGRTLANITQIPLVLLAAGLSAFGFKKKWKAVLMLTFVLAMFPGASGYYSVSFYLFPLMFLLLERERSAFDLFYLVFLSFLILPIQFLTGLFGFGFGTMIQLLSTAQLVLILGLCAEAICKLVERKKENNRYTANA